MSQSQLSSEEDLAERGPMGSCENLMGDSEFRLVRVNKIDCIY